MFVKPNPERTVSVHQGGSLDKGRIVGGEVVDVPVQVLDPHTRAPIPTDGYEVPEDAYWMRHLRNGDLVLVEPKAVPNLDAERASLPPPEPAQHEEHAE